MINMIYTIGVRVVQSGGKWWKSHIMNTNIIKYLICYINNSIQHMHAAEKFFGSAREAHMR